MRTVEDQVKHIPCSYGHQTGRQPRLVPAVTSHWPFSSVLFRKLGNNSVWTAQRLRSERKGHRYITQSRWYRNTLIRSISLGTPKHHPPKVHFSAQKAGSLLLGKASAFSHVSIIWNRQVKKKNNWNSAALSFPTPPLPTGAADAVLRDTV